MDFEIYIYNNYSAIREKVTTGLLLAYTNIMHAMTTVLKYNFQINAKKI